MNCFEASIVVALAGFSAATPAVAQGSASAVPGQPAATGPKLNPNERICETQEVTGSRISTRRVCLTRAQWADRKLQERQAVERVQVQRGSTQGQ